MPEVVRDLGKIRREHGRLAILLSEGRLERPDAERLAVLDDELVRFDAMCMRTKPLRLYAAGILPGDELRHPATGAIARCVTMSRVEMRGETMSLMEATRRIAAEGAKAPAIGDWHARGIRAGDGWGERPCAAEGKPNPIKAAPNLELPF